MGVKPRYNPKIIPACVYSSPELAAVGMTEKQVKDSGIEYAIGRFDLSGNGRAVIDGTPGRVKIIADKKIGEILGVHILGPGATEMIAEAAICMSMEGTAEDIVNTIHAHPTVSEAVCEAAMSVFGKPIHGIQGNAD
jgi:dihydrolipoamide dehydrogenase